jgi:hypothetical protein
MNIVLQLRRCGQAFEMESQAGSAPGFSAGQSCALPGLDLSFITCRPLRTRHTTTQQHCAMGAGTVRSRPYQDHPALKSGFRVPANDQRGLRKTRICQAHLEGSFDFFGCMVGKPVLFQLTSPCRSGIPI